MAHFKQQSAVCSEGAGILVAKSAEGERSDDSRARVVDAFAGRGAWVGRVGLGRLFVRTCTLSGGMRRVWSLYQMNITVILYVRIRISEDPDFRTPSDRRAVCVSVCARRRRAKVGILGNSNSYVQNNCKLI